MWNRIIVLTTVLLVVGPIFVGQFSNERTLWHLAAAANSVEIGVGDYEDSLKKATESAVDVTLLRDYWILRFKKALDGDLSDIPVLVAEARAKNPEFASIGLQTASKLEAMSEFALAVEVLEAAIDESIRKQPTILNYLAYMRSLAGFDLDRALVDINAALAFYPNEPAFRDTRAWVLFQMGRPLEALPDAEFAISKLEKSAASSELWQTVTELLEEVLPGDASPPSDGQLTSDADSQALGQQEVAPEVWAEGALRYHRGRILEALGRNDEAEVDWQWLTDRQLPRDDRLH